MPQQLAKADTYRPTAAMARNARQALEVRASKPPSQRGMTSVGLARARQLVNRQPLSLDTVKRIKAYFDRHAVDKGGSTWEDQGKGWQAWQGWGGDEGWAWAKRILASEASREKMAKDHSWSVSVPIEKVDQDQRLVFGWLYVARDRHGHQVVDHSGETITTKELEKATYDFTLTSRQAGQMHEKIGVGRLVEVVCFTAEKRKAMGIPDGVLPDGTWVGFKIDDDEAWAGVKSGRFKMFSLGGKAIRRDLANA